MSDNIPYDIQTDIIKRLPIESVIKFRSISKAWKCIIDGSDFIACYRGHQQHLRLKFYHLTQKPNYVSVVDDDTFPLHKVSLSVPQMVKMLNSRFFIVGSSRGLCCLYSSYLRDLGYTRRGTAILWNVSIRKAVAVVEPNRPDIVYGMYETCLGFGVCCETNDPKLVQITCIGNNWEDVKSISCIPWQVEVFALSTGAWRSSYSNLPRKSLRFFWQPVVVDGCLYWLVVDRIAIDDRYRYLSLIISFDLTSEEFREINLPDSLAKTPPCSLLIFKLKESLVVVEREYMSFSVSCMMEDGVSKSFTKLFTVNIGYPTVSGFTKSGDPIVYRLCFDTSRRYLYAVYDPNSKQIKNIEISDAGYKFFVCPYMETLLLVDQPDSIIYDEGKRYIENFKVES
ncbi:putative F-box protein At1g32420 [Bidens hawaiensis]|uniref:putative F-box protein At1g32420 n=1 Tax=Bidens hawaiensis TaxID=980011 RepID=UPI00404B31C8